MAKPSEYPEVQKPTPIKYAEAPPTQEPLLVNSQAAQGTPAYYTVQGSSTDPLEQLAIWQNYIQVLLFIVGVFGVVPAWFIGAIIPYCTRYQMPSCEKCFWRINLVLSIILGFFFGIIAFTATIYSAFNWALNW